MVILGQDPYPTPGRATGLAFSFPKGARPRHSLKNILTELATDPEGLKRMGEQAARIVDGAGVDAVIAELEA